MPCCDCGRNRPCTCSPRSRNRAQHQLEQPTGKTETEAVPRRPMPTRGVFKSARQLNTSMVMSPSPPYTTSIDAPMLCKVDHRAAGHRAPDIHAKFRLPGIIEAYDPRDCQPSQAMFIANLLQRYRSNMPQNVSRIEQKSAELLEFTVFSTEKQWCLFHLDPNSNHPETTSSCE